jgi:hypothetical protein
MGMTSCKNNTEVDPNDQNNVKTPTQPSISIKISADVTITVIASGDLAAQWAKLDSKTVEKLREQSTLNVLVKSGSYKLDGGVLQLPNFFAGAKATTGKVVNVQFDGGFQNADYLNTQKDGKKALTLNTDLLAGNQVNFILPAGNYDVNIETTKTEASLSGADTNIGYFTFKAASDKSATSIKNGVTIKRAVPGTGDIKIAGGALEAKVIKPVAPATTVAEAQANNYNSTAGAGFPVGGQAAAYNLFIESGTATITNIAKEAYKIGTVTIAKGAGVIFSEAKPYITKIVGEDAGCTISFTDGGTDAGSTTNLANVGAIEKGKLSLGSALILKNDIFTNVEFATAVIMGSASVTGVAFNALTLNYTADNQTYTFNGVDFKLAPTITGTLSTVTSSSTTLYEWVVSGTSGSWVAVKDNDPANLKEYNKNETIQEFNATKVNVVAGKLTGNTWEVTSKVIKITTDTKASLRPENAVIALDSACKIAGAAINGTNINAIFAPPYTDTTTTPATVYAGVPATEAWYIVSVDGAAYKWKQATDGSYVLIK